MNDKSFENVEDSADQLSKEHEKPERQESVSQACRPTGKIGGFHGSNSFGERG
jgi:hypothetical protein